MTLVFPLIAVFTLAGLLYAERQNNVRLKGLFKPITSALFLLTALSGGPSSAYDRALFAGLMLCALGDVLLIPKNRPRWFLAGLVAFLLGHAAYIAAFNGLAPVTSLSVPALGLIVAVSAALFLWFRPRLGAMLAPVVAYIIVITLMLCSAWAVFFAGGGATDTFRAFVALGATAFYVSDITVARDRFMSAGFLNRLIGLPLYYLGQFLLALSIGVS